VLFKYLPIERIDVLENLRIRFSPLRSLNDPYESLPLIDVDDLVARTLQVHSAELDEIWKNIDESEKTPEKAARLEENREAMIKGVESSLNQNTVGEGLMDMMGDSFGVLSLSRSNKSLLILSHYSISKAGFVIGFDDSNEFFHQRDQIGNIVHPTPVKYSGQRAVVKRSDHNWRNNLLCHKPIEWAYEEEERLFMALMDKTKSVAKDEFGADVILYDLPPETISTVYIGCKASDETRKKIYDAVRVQQLSCTLFEAFMSPTEYQIIFRESNA
jgi:hypothetical protein